MPTMLTTPQALMDWADAHRAAGRSIGLVPTMGALHAGHASLLSLARAEVDVLVASIFVNPLQFGEGEDLDTYPRTLDADRQLCAAEGADAIFAPSPAAMYPSDFSTVVDVERVSEGLCGGHRPGHFRGVTTVVLRLFGLSRADVAVFGQKDFQQLAVLRRMARDLGLPVQIIGAPIVRDADGLALSSRNAYLSAEERARALSLSGALAQVCARAARGETQVAALLAAGRAALDVDGIDYLEVVDAQTLQPLLDLSTHTGPVRALVAAYVGTTRLIDNCDLAEGPNLPAAG